VFQVELSPIENAAKTIESKTVELSEIIENVEYALQDSSQTFSISPLSMTLNGE
jgi:hypothetical protein